MTKIDRVYEEADQMRHEFEELQFTRGVAMLDYI